MILSDFIKETLVEIAKGAKGANDEYISMGHGGVNPEGKFKIEGIPFMLVEGRLRGEDRTKPIVSVQFKLNIEIEENNQLNGGIGGILNVIPVSVGGSKHESSKSVQEVSFSIPVVLPSNENQK